MSSVSSETPGGGRRCKMEGTNGRPEDKFKQYETQPDTPQYGSETRGGLEDKTQSVQPRQQEAAPKERDASEQVKKGLTYPINMEFIYYSGILKVLAPALTNESDRQKVIPWLKKLFGPVYYAMNLRDKRNRYLMYLTLTLMNNELVHPFTVPPPSVRLPDLVGEPSERINAAEWERDPMWKDTIAILPSNVRVMKCTMHTNCPPLDKRMDSLLDDEFQFFLYLARPYAALFTNPEEKTKVATWLQVLCTIQGPVCPVLKGIRNDYIQALLGFIYDLRVAGPFMEYPSWGSLRPLAEAAKFSAQKYRFNDPTSKDADEFLMQQPIPENGAFCYVTVTGELMKSSMKVPAPDELIDL